MLFEKINSIRCKKLLKLLVKCEKSAVWLYQKALFTD